jgi:segregation and condensation protein A
MLKELKEMDFRISGKMVLASSLLLKIKSDKLLLEDIAGLDSLINGPEQEDFLDDDGFEFEQQDLQAFFNDQKKIIPRTPQPRERQVSVFDLVDALEQALSQDSKRQRVLSRHRDEVEVHTPKSVFDLSETMETIQEKLGKLFVKPTTRVFFDDLIPDQSKEAKVYTFLPLLHLENQQKVALSQEEHFGPIEVTIYNRKL